MTDDELQLALSALPRERKPPLLRLPSRRRPYLQAAAAILLLLLGAVAGRSWPSPPPSYVLLINDDAAPGDEASRVREYRAWGSEQHIRGNTLAGAREVIPPYSAVRSSVSVAGFFFIDAGSENEAMRIAKSCPHLQHGGSVELRRVEH